MRGAWRQLTSGVAALFRREREDAGISEEVAHYLEELTAAHLARGLSAAEARRAALLELGGEAQVRETVRGYGWENVVEAFVRDVRLGVRSLRGSPAYATASILTLAVGIGGAAAIFSAVRPILLDPLPYPEAGRVRTIVELQPDGTRGDGSFGMYRGLAERTRGLEAIAVHRPWQPTLTGTGQAERLDGQHVSVEYLRVLGVAPRLGRDFTAADDRAGGPAVVIMSDALWRRRFGADSTVLGGTVRLDGVAHTVIGVMPAGFENVLAPDAELWAPLQYDLAEGRAWGHHLGTVGRLRAGVVPEDAVRELNEAARDVLATARPDTYSGDERWMAPSLSDEITRGVRPALLAIAVAVALLLVMACVNTANLVLARIIRRGPEFALRMTLGAGRGRIARQLVAEGAVLAVAGGALGVVVAHAGVRALVTLAPAGLARTGAIHVDARTLLFAAILTALAGTVAGIVPALRIARNGDDVASTGSRHTAGLRHRRVRGALVVAQVAMALVLLSGSGLLLRSLQRVLQVPAGFDATNALTLQIRTAGARFADDASTRRFFDAVLDDASAVPGVAAAALTSQLPLSGDHDSWGVHFESSPTLRPDEDRSAFRYAVSPGWFETVGIPLRSGRTLRVEDRAGAPLAVVISESLARRRFPEGNAIGQRLRIGPHESAPWTVVGVVGDVTQQSLALGPSDAAYITMDQWRFADPVMTLVVRAHGDVRPLSPALRDVVRTIDPEQPVTRVARLDELLAASAAERRFALIIFQAFALAALILAATGLYGVIAGSVSDRTREIGIRAALGATRPAIIAMILAQGLRLTATGVATGTIAALFASRAMETLLFEVSPTDPATYIGVAALLAGVSLIACCIPAWRAGRTDPADTLRAG